MNEGYHQLELDEDSRHLTAFYGTDCKMRYTRLNYGTISARNIFDKVMNDTIDFIIFDLGHADHDKAQALKQTDPPKTYLKCVLS